jgi:DNA-binding response OmpR family regulator
VTTRVLVVEDDDSIREMVGLSLQDAGYAVMDARDGHLAIELVKEQPADVVLVDLRMPLMDGFEFMRRYAEAGGRAPIIVLSAARDVDFTRQEVQAAAIIEKPFDLNDLLDTVERVAPPSA